MPYSSEHSLQQLVELTRLTYVGEYVATLNGASVPVTIPLGAEAALISARGGDVYFNVNGLSAAPATSGGFVGQSLTGVIPIIENFVTLHVYGAAGAYAHIMFFKHG